MKTTIGLVTMKNIRSDPSAYCNSWGYNIF
ncbi:hypothetical protein THERMOT_2032 [Bathymodiolus thermophilus thioautotrophic gill symbiont]|uniref:Uncharacterized protein n=1 Tax=Bathymodiolus thermophilus thioautotrophic gill symbiont TaxID=2360 RepID=A0A8H8XEV7_9GAMM|nr:hypothetical protein THERMOS_1533 [Bathymodiolus thermophilus thioautotrophic gill symbiont]CAB5504813.1 hypothetical protein THERMOT_2032 [Bathymodiolus thermophilus thioautotrophic gill symbiont]